MMDYVRAIDLRKWTSGPVMMYFLEIVPSKPTCVVELWSATVPPVYQNVSFGEDLFYKAMDITVDSNDIVYVLDNNATARPTIYAFDSNGEWIGTSGVIPLSAISGFALRIDAALSTVPNEVHVLHTLGVTRFSMP
jgi:hypothetical protein